MSSGGNKKIYKESDSVSQTVYQTIRNHQNFINTKYDSANRDHENLLRSIFKIIFGSNLTSEELLNNGLWSKLGFQNKDPTSDLRSLGLLGLSTMEYQCKYQTSMVKNEFMNREYPYACCVFSIVNFMVEQMNMRILTSTPIETPIILLMKKELFFNSTIIKQMDLFERLCCILFEYFDKLWTKHNASYMDFQIIFDLFKKNVNNILKKEPGNYRYVFII